MLEIAKTTSITYSAIPSCNNMGLKHFCRYQNNNKTNGQFIQANLWMPNLYDTILRQFDLLPLFLSMIAGLDTDCIHSSRTISTLGVDD